MSAFPKSGQIADCLGMSALCHKPTYAVQQRVPLFDETTSKSPRARHAGEPGLPSDLHVIMHPQIVETDRQLTRRYVASVPRCWAMWIGRTESRSAGGTDQAAGC